MIGPAWTAQRTTSGSKNQGEAMSTSNGWDSSYEWKAVLVLSLAFGLVGLDRFVLPPLFPAMMKDLGLNYQDIGNLVGILGVAWGLSAIFVGNLSDRLGRRNLARRLRGRACPNSSGSIPNGPFWLIAVLLHAGVVTKDMSTTRSAVLAAVERSPAAAGAHDRAGWVALFTVTRWSRIRSVRVRMPGVPRSSSSTTPSSVRRTSPSTVTSTSCAVSPCCATWCSKIGHGFGGDDAHPRHPAL